MFTEQYLTIFQNNFTLWDTSFVFVLSETHDYVMRCQNSRCQINQLNYRNFISTTILDFNILLNATYATTFCKSMFINLYTKKLYYMQAVTMPQSVLLTVKPMFFFFKKIILPPSYFFFST